MLRRLYHRAIFAHARPSVSARYGRPLTEQGESTPKSTLFSCGLWQSNVSNEPSGATINDATRFKQLQKQYTIPECLLSNPRETTQHIHK